MSGISVERLREVLNYDPDTGNLTWRVKLSTRCHVGKLAGYIGPSMNGKRYRNITVDRVKLSAAQVSWAIFYGKFPGGDLRFKSNNTLDTRIENLAEEQFAHLRDCGIDTTTQAGQIEHRRQKKSNKTILNRANHLKYTFGIDVAEYQKMYVEQKGLCANCKNPETTRKNGAGVWLSIDHDHETGAIRGLLCYGCNNAIGLCHDDPEILRSAADYIERHKAANNNVVPIRTKETV